MKVIGDIVLSLNYDEFASYDSIYFSNFQFQSRFVGNYLRRELRKSNFEPIGYKRLLINACRSACPSNRLSLTQLYLETFVPFDRNLYDNTSRQQLADFFIDLYFKGIEKVNETHAVPIRFIRDKLEQFRTDNYKNEWIFKSKIFKAIGIKAVLFCQMTMNNFTLSLILYKKKKVVFNHEILKTLPDEIIYHYQFKDLELQNNKIIVTGWYDSPPLYELDISFEAALIKR